MNILFLTQVLPYPLDAGPKVRAYYMLRHLSRAHQVTLVSFVRPDDRPEYVAHLRGIAHAVHTVPMRRSAWRNIRAGVKGLLTGLPITIVRDEMPEMAALLRRLTAETRFDAIHADQLAMAWWGLLATWAHHASDPSVVAQPFALFVLRALRVPSRLRAPNTPALLLDAHNAIYRLTERMAAEARGPGRWLIRREAAAFRRYEAAVLRACDAILTVTQEDRGHLLTLLSEMDDVQSTMYDVQDVRDDVPLASNIEHRPFDIRHSTFDIVHRTFDIPHSTFDVTVLPICVDPDQVAAVPRAPGGPPTILHLGTMFWPPNVAGVLWFAREVLPRVHAALPDARFVVVGKNPPPEVQGLAADPRVAVTGYVADATPYLAGADVFVVPLSAGGGMRVKILDAWLWGLPVVATPIGAEGIALRDGENILIAAGADAFAAAVVRCLADPALNARLRAAGRAWVAENYAWQTVYRRVDEVYARLLAPKVSFQSVEGDRGHRPP